MDRQEIKLAIENRVVEKMKGFRDVLKNLMNLKSLENLGRDPMGRCVVKAKVRPSIERDDLGRRIFQKI